ncbi:gamma-parvin isoform X2 [Scleropages formosus]|uniref:gamma-parvin isoform X2 n=1 Tax=Scleropages formosus TaxID=113540 RepID=UPI000879067B|nr:gamma-parvin isoform X2 [Scleropages formosus]XP_018602582.1 gamma-parvin isoform X2 [Scleropages formosus]XP_018602583.1 gamma-parvin isoform X2 [Scleropages formosus]
MEESTDKVLEEAFLQVNTPDDLEMFQEEKRKIIQPTSLNNPGLEKLKEVLITWINSTLKQEHIVVQSLEEDLYDGLVLHHLLERLAGVRLSVEEIALTRAAQTHKVEVTLEALNQSLGVDSEASSRWSVRLIHSKDLLATLHLLVAMVKRFQPDLQLPSGISVEVLLVEVTKGGIKSDKQTEQITEAGKSSKDQNANRADPIDELLRMEPQKVDTVKKAIVHFVNKNMAPLGLQVTDMEKQFADGVILLLLIGQVKGYFIPLSDFNLTPVTNSEMLQNVTLALDLLNDEDLLVSGVEPEDIISQDMAATLKVLYAIFKKHKNI